MLLAHKAGDKLFVDYAGPTLPITDPKTGEITDAQIFVGALGASNYTFAEATLTSMTISAASATTLRRRNRRQTMLEHPTLDKLASLKLTGMLEAMQEQRQMSEYGELSFEERLGMLVDRETTVRKTGSSRGE